MSAPAQPALPYRCACLHPSAPAQHRQSCGAPCRAAPPPPPQPEQRRRQLAPAGVRASAWCRRSGAAPRRHGQRRQAGDGKECVRSRWHGVDARPQRGGGCLQAGKREEMIPPITLSTLKGMGCPSPPPPPPGLCPKPCLPPVTSSLQHSFAASLRRRPLRCTAHRSPGSASRRQRIGAAP